jgi:hypothetical protein
VAGSWNPICQGTDASLNSIWQKTPWAAGCLVPKKKLKVLKVFDIFFSKLKEIILDFLIHTLTKRFALG